MNILKSASKIVFILFAATICLSFLTGLLEQDEFVKLAMMPLVFYFANKGETQTSGAEAYAGK